MNDENRIKKRNWIISNQLILANEFETENSRFRSGSDAPNDNNNLKKVNNKGESSRPRGGEQRENVEMRSYGSTFNFKRAQSPSLSVSTPSASSHLLSRRFANEAFIYMALPPDGGYGWVILFCSILIGIIIDGNLLSVGIILPAIENGLNVGKSTTAFIASVQITTHLSIGPIASAIINRFGFRIVGIIGGVISVASLFLSSICRDPYSLTIALGLIFGLGSGVAKINSELIVAYYFAKYRAIACGINSASTGIGLLIYAAVNSYLIKRTAWYNVLLAMSISIAMCAIIPLAFKRIPLKKMGKIIDAAQVDDQSIESVEINLTRFNSFIDEKDESQPQNKTIAAQKSQEQKPPQTEEQRRREAQQPGASKMKDVPSAAHRSEHTSGSSSGNTVNGIKDIVIGEDPLDRVDIFAPQVRNYEITEIDQIEATQIYETEHGINKIAYTMSNSHTSMIPEKSKSKPPPTKEVKHKPCRCHPKMVKSFHLLFDPKLLKCTEFQLFLIASFAFTFANFTPYLYCVERTKIPLKYKNFLLSFMGIINIILRIVLGFIAFYTEGKSPLLCGVCVIIGGLGVLFSCFFDHDMIWFEYMYCTLFTLGSAAFFSLRSIVLIQILGLQHLTNAYGLNCLALGISSFAGMNLAGKTVALTKSYETAFLISGVLMVFSGVIILAIPKITSCLKNMKRKPLISRK